MLDLGQPRVECVLRNYRSYGRFKSNRRRKKIIARELVSKSLEVQVMTLTLEISKLGSVVSRLRDATSRVELNPIIRVREELAPPPLRHLGTIRRVPVIEHVMPQPSRFIVRRFGVCTSCIRIYQVYCFAIGATKKPAGDGFR